MSDALFLSLWFPSFRPEEIMPRTLAVLHQFPFSELQPGVSYLAVRPINWSEATVLERRFQAGVLPEEAAEIASEFLQPDYAYRFECYWDLWMPHEGHDSPILQPSLVTFTAHGIEFDDQVYLQEGHMEVDLGLDAPFLYEDLHWSALVENRFRANVEKLVAFTQAIEKHCGITGRVLWSESDENLAQKLIDRLQRVQ
jgi:hypothetical protein